MLKARRKHGQKKLDRTVCEICSYSSPKPLHVHHIIPRCDPRCSQDNWNLCVVCPTCHHLVHQGEITIIGVYRATNETGRKVMFFKKGEPPPIEEEYWLIKDNPLVVRKEHKNEQ